MKNKLSPQVKELLRYINTQPILIGLLYDLDLMPEQVMDNPPDYRRMMILSLWYRSTQTKPAATAETTK